MTKIGKANKGQPREACWASEWLSREAEQGSRLQGRVIKGSTSIKMAPTLSNQPRNIEPPTTMARTPESGR